MRLAFKSAHMTLSKKEIMKIYHLYLGKLF